MNLLKNAIENNSCLLNCVSTKLNFTLLCITKLVYLLKSECERPNITDIYLFTNLQHNHMYIHTEYNMYVCMALLL